MTKTYAYILVPVILIAFILSLLHMISCIVKKVVHKRQSYTRPTRIYRTRYSRNQNPPDYDMTDRV